MSRGSSFPSCHYRGLLVPSGGNKKETRMKTNLAQLEQAEMDKVNVDWRQPGWHLKSATICQLSRRRSNVSSQSIYAPGFASG